MQQFQEAEKLMDVQSISTIYTMLTGAWSSSAIQVVARFGLADYLETEPMSVSDLAQATGTHAPSLYRLLRAVASLGIFQETSPQVFTQTALSSLLCTGHPNSVRYYAMYLLSPAQMLAWSDLAYSIESGKPTFEHQAGMSLWQFLQAHPDEHTVFNKAMQAHQSATSDLILRTYDFSSIRSLADMGGGYGHFALMALQRYPTMQAILFDQPAVIEEARRSMAWSEYSDRCHLQGGDFFQAVPSAVDAYFFQAVLFNWDDEHYVAILRSCRQTMSDQSKLLIVEPMMTTTTSFGPAFADLQMLAILPEGARVRSLEEHQSLCIQAGFSSIRVFSTPTPYSLLEVTRQ